MSADEQKVEPDRNQLWELHQYVAADGRRIQELKPTEGSDLPLSYKGVCMIITPMGPQEMNFPILNAESVQEAIEAFEDAAKVGMEQVKKRASEPKIAVPRGLPGGPPPPNTSGGIVLP